MPEMAGRQLGAACAAYVAGYVRTAQGNYLEAFVRGRVMGPLAAAMALLIGGSVRRAEGSAPS